MNKTTVFNDKPATFDTIQRIEEWKAVADDYYANHSEAVILCNNGKGEYALEDI